MKKLISVIVAVIMIASLIPAVVNAEADEEYVRSGDNGNVIVPYTTGEGITIDGTLAQGEWSETNKLALEGKKTMKTWGIGVFEGTIDFYYSWGDAGLYMAAVVYDNLIGDGASDGALATRFQIALNPAGIICEDYPGLFFSLTPLNDSDEVMLMRHNWQTGTADDGYFVEQGEDGYAGKYTFIKDGENIIGWNLECIVPWEYIATADRYTDLDDTDEIYLTNFNPKDENRARAFCTATIAYVQHHAPDAASITSTARTCTDGDPSIWTVDSYDLILLFALPGETDRSTETEYFTGNVVTEPDTTDADVTTEAVTEADATTGEETEPTTESETAVETEDNATTTEAEPAGDATTDAPTTDKPTDDKTTGGLSTPAIIGIIVAAVVVVAAIVIAIVLGKKKKA